MELTGNSYLTSCKPGNVRWAAPELLIPLQGGSPCRACVKSDIYSVGCVMLQASQLVTLWYKIVDSQCRYFLAACPMTSGTILWLSVRSSRVKNFCEFRNFLKLQLMTAIGNLALLASREREKERTVTVKQIASFHQERIGRCKEIWQAQAVHT